MIGDLHGEGRGFDNKGVASLLHHYCIFLSCNYCIKIVIRPSWQINREGCWDEADDQDCINGEGGE